MSSAAGTRTWSVSSASGPPDASPSTTTSGQAKAASVSAFEVSDDLSADPVDRPDHHDSADVRPEAVDGEVRRDPFGERHHRDVDQEVEEPEGDDDQRQRQDRQQRLDDGVRQTEDRRADQVPGPAVDGDAVP